MPENSGCFSEIGLDGRGFFIARTLNELQVGASFVRSACDQIRDSQPKDNELLLSVIHRQQESFLQKLFEALTYCVQFRKANQHDSFEHFLRLLDLDQMLAKNAHQREYLGKISDSDLEREERYRAEILEREAVVPSLKSSWYVNNNSKRLKEAGCNLVPVKSLYQQTHMLIEEPLQAVIIALYEIIFAATDGANHFYPSKLRTFGFEDFGLVSYLFKIQSLLANAVLKECCHLAEIEGGPCSQRILQSEELTDWCREHKYDSNSHPMLHKGDYVVAHLCLCQIVDMHRSAYGLVSYNVKLIDQAFPEKNIPMAGNNWIQANHVKIFLKGTDPKARDQAQLLEIWSEHIDEIV